MTEEQLNVILNQKNRTSIFLGVIGTGAGIITTFIGANFLKLYQATIKQSSKYTDGLSKINTVGISMEILSTIRSQSDKQGVSTIKDDDSLALQIVETKIRIAELLVKQLHEIPTDKSTEERDDEET